jgi:hypothetical protein
MSVYSPCVQLFVCSVPWECQCFVALDTCSAWREHGLQRSLHDLCGYVLVYAIL